MIDDSLPASATINLYHWELAGLVFKLSSGLVHTLFVTSQAAVVELSERPNRSVNKK
jgi:hypothetical protein